MSIKKLFDSHKANNSLVSTSLEEEVVKNAPELESADNVREQIERIDRFIPQVDYSDPNNFARYGSAESYYEDAISRITNKFPYDGSEEEITRFHNESNYLDLYLFDTEYPRTNGYITLATPADSFTAVAAAQFADGPVHTTLGWVQGGNSEQYIKTFGGPNAVAGGMTTGSFHTQFTSSNFYDTDIYTNDGTLALDRVGTRESNLKLNLSNGFSTEFWIYVNSTWPKTGTGAATVYNNQIIYDQWNQIDSGSSGHGRLLIYLTGSYSGHDPFQVHLGYGTDNVWDIEFGGSSVTTASLLDTWNHVAFTFDGTTSTAQAKFYLNGSLIQTSSSSDIDGTSLDAPTQTFVNYLGAGQTYPSGTLPAGQTLFGTTSGYNQFVGSLDEFRYWKSIRTEKEILENYWTQVRGGTNNEVANAELGVYYKFNEGITGTSSVDSVVLDYSGRVSNGAWSNYPGSSARSTDSAIVSASAATSEYKDPIIYSHHDDVAYLRAKLTATGSVYDYQNQSSLMDSIPNWIVDEDLTKNNGELKKLTQIIGSYFDTLQLQTENLSKLKDKTYMSASFKPTPFTGRLLSAAGLEVPDIFIDATLLEKFAQRSDDRPYTMDINEVKNLIYQNIYNNLTYLYKSKGTEKAFRNLIRCYGIGDDVVKFNAYGNNTTFTYSDNHQETTARKKYIDFGHPTRWDGVVYQNSSSTNTENGNATYISASATKGAASTAEIEIVFPKAYERTNPLFYNTPFITSSIFGWSQANTIPSNFTRYDARNLHLYAVRTDQNSKDVYFMLSGNADDGDAPGDGLVLTSDVYSNVYDNQKWNFALRIKHKTWPNYSGTLDTDDVFPDDVDVELYGVNVENGVIRNSFTLSTSSVSSLYATSTKRYQFGARRYDYTGSTIYHYSDVKASSIRFYDTNLDNEVVNAHALDPNNFGTKHPSRNFYAQNPETDADALSIPEVTSLVFDLDFSQVTSSDAYGYFTADDNSSGSLDFLSRYTSGSVIMKNTQQYAFQGYFPSDLSSTGVVSNEFIQASRQRLPEVVNTNNAVNVLSRDDELFPRDRAINQTFFAFEKSMYGVVSQEMLNMFATIVEFNDLIGKLTNKYREGYKDLRLLRNLFFEKIENDPDLDKFIDYYKWIDHSLIIFLQQFVPASANVSEEIRVMVEDHILGRSKYRHKYTQLKSGNSGTGTKAGTSATAGGIEIEARVTGPHERDYNWRFGHAPLRQPHVVGDQATNSIWWKERALATNAGLITGSQFPADTEANIDSAVQSIKSAYTSFNSASANKLNDNAGNIYEGSTYAMRSLSQRPVKINALFQDDIGGGYNYPRGQKPDGIFPLIKKGGPAFWRPENKAVPDIAKEELRPVIKQEKRRVTGINTSENNGTIGEGGQVLGAIVGTKYLTPFVPFSSSVSPANGYGQSMQTGDDETILLSAGEATGYHNDSYGDDYEVPMQGPFTERHVGGNRHRHIDLNEGSDTALNRPEAWNLELAGVRSIFNEGDSSSSRLSTRPNYRRDETAKRPVNIKNIKHRTGSLGTVAMGNYSASYEVVSTTGRNINNSYFIKSEGLSTASVTADTDAYVDGLIDFARPVRTRTSHVIVSRFSAPGSPESMGDAHGGPGLDYEAAELSPYNNLNYRNTTVREPLQTLLTERSERYGLRSGSAVSSEDYHYITASYHKTNRNTQYRIYDHDYDDAGTQTEGTGTLDDNYYVQHMIPQSDFQYSWITSSADRFRSETYNNGGVILGYFPYDGLSRVTSSVDGYSYVNAINFSSSSVSASGVGNIAG